MAGAKAAKAKAGQMASDAGAAIERAADAADAKVDAVAKKVGDAKDAAKASVKGKINSIANKVADASKFQSVGEEVFQEGLFLMFFVFLD